MEIAFLVLKGTITADTPIHVGDGRHFSITKQTRLYMPGSMLRGAVGIALVKTTCENPDNIMKHEECPSKEECLYFQLFQGEGNKASRVIFRNAYPKHVGCAKDGTYIPASRTLFRCEKFHERKNTYDPPLVCTKCGGPMKSFEDYICTECEHIDPFPIKIQRKTSTAIDRRKYSAAMITPIVGEEGYGTLHSRDILPKDAECEFRVVLHRDVKASIDLFIRVLEKALPDEGIGGGKSRGLGKISVKVNSVREVTQDMLDKRAEEIDVSDFTVRLISDIVSEGLTLPSSMLLSAARRAYTWTYHEGAPMLPDVTPQQQLIATGLTSGWSIRENKRRDVLPVIRAGSVFRFRSVKNQQLARALAALEYLAIGSYKPHGYGQIRIEKIS